MIIEIILIAIVVLFIVGVILYMTLNTYSDWDDTFPLVCYIVGGIFTFGALMIGGVQIHTNQSSSIKTKEYELQEKFTFFENRKKIIESYHTITDGNKTTFTSDITLETLSTDSYYQLVDSYNKEVFTFKVNVVSNQNNRNNPWISWFYSPAYSVISEEDLNNLTYTIGK